MLANNPLTFLLASREPALLSTVQPILQAAGNRVEVVLSAEAALAAMTASTPLSLALLDTKLPGMAPGIAPAIAVDQLLAAVDAEATTLRFPIVLIADTVAQEWVNRLQEGVIDDVILRSAEAGYWKLRIDMVLRAHRLTHEFNTLRESATTNAQLDRLTGVYNRQALFAMLFRETDRVQRSNSDLCLVLFDIDDFGHWNSRLGADVCDELLCQVAARTTRLLRSYDLLGRPGKDEFLVVLPGCSANNAMMLAERLRMDVFSVPFRVGGDSIRLSACFGIASSHGRSPVVVLREAEQALGQARDVGPESIQYYGDSARPYAPPVTFLSPTSGDELLAW